MSAPPASPTPTLSDAARALLDRRAAVREAAGDAIPRRGDDTCAPLSTYQQRLWLFDQVHPGSTAYNRPRAFRITGPLNVHALERALATIVERHHVVRSALLLEDAAPVQRVCEVRVTVPVTDLRGECATGLSRLDELLRDEASRPFDLRAPPLIHARLFRTGEQEHVLLLTLHHAASDGWSDGVLYRELGPAYDAWVEGCAPALEPLPIQYGDYAAWERVRLDAGAYASDIDAWLARLADAPRSLDLPTDRPRTPERSFAGGTRRLRIARPPIDRLRTLAAEERATLAMGLLAVYDVLLMRYSRQTDVVVGVPIAGRTRHVLEPLIGFFSNTLPVRVDLSDDPSFRELLRRVRAASIDAYARQDLPFDAIVDALRQRSPDAVDSGASVVQVMLNVRNTPAATLALGNLDVRPIEIDAARAPVDLNLEITEGADGIDGVAEYASALFDAATVDRMLVHFARIIDAAAVSPELPVSRLPILTDVERERALVVWNSTERPLPFETTVHDLIAAQAARTPDDIAVCDERERLTYAQVVDRAQRLACDLQERGVVAGTLVGVCVERSADLLVALLGVLQAGGAYVPLDPDLPAERLGFMLEDARPLAIVVDRTNAARVPETSAARVVLDDAYWSAASHGAPRALATPESIAYVIYTSGSTGRPKGVLNTHRAIANRLLWMQAEGGVRATDVVLQKTPASFDVSVPELFGPLITGARPVMARPDGHLDNEYLASVIARERITVVHFVPSMLQRFLDEASPEACASLREILCSGEALPLALARRVVQRLPHVALHNLYGPTEAAVEVSHWRFDPASERATVPIGRPIANVRLYVLDAHMQPVPVGVAGELFIGGIAVAQGYLHRPELTAERFVPDPFVADPSARLYRTGDIVRQDVHGVIDYVGRVDHQVKLQGVRIECGEIEAVLATHPGVRDVLVTTAETPTGERRLVAYVVPHGGRDGVDDALLRAHMRERLPEALVPGAFIRLDAFPLTPSGKTDRRALPTPTFGAEESRRPYRAPRTPTEVALVRLWCETLGVERVGIHDDFFALGGHSLAAARVIGRLRSVLGVTVPIRIVFEHPTIASLAASIVAYDETPPSPLVRLQPGAPGATPLFLLHGDFNGGGLYCRALARRLGADRPVYALYPHEPGTCDTIEAMAADYVERIRRTAAGPYVLAGYCNGASVAYEIACRLQAAGEAVSLLVLIDAAAPHPLLVAMHRVIHGAASTLGIDAERARNVYLGAREHVFRLAELLPPREPPPSLPEYGNGAWLIATNAVAGVLRRLGRAVGALIGVREPGPDPVLEEPWPGDEGSELLGWRGVWYARRMRDYVPRRFDGRVTVIIPSARVRRRTEDATLNWARLTRGVDVHVIPGSHLSIVASEVEPLAATLRASIERATHTA